MPNDKEDFVKLVAESTADAETPKSFLYWGTIAAVGALSNNNVYLNRRHPESKKIVYKLAPNVFVIFIAESGLGKGFPIWLAKKIVKEVNCTRVIAGRNSMESIIQEMSRARSYENGKILSDSICFLVSGEFHNLLISNPQALTMLTEWYDTHFMDDWENTLKHSTVEKLKNINVTLLGGSSPAHFEQAVPEANVEGGFIGRALMVYENKRGKTSALTMVDEPDEEESYSPVTPEIIERAKEIANIKGRMKWTIEAQRMFDPWYNKWRDTKFADKTGTYNRVPDNVLKVAMCLSLSRRSTLTLEAEDIREAITGVLSLMQNTLHLTEGKGKQAFAPGARTIMNLLIQAEECKMSRRDVLNRGAGQFDADDLTRIENTLRERGIIDITREDGTIWYQLTETAIKSYQKFIKRGS